MHRVFAGVPMLLAPRLALSLAVVLLASAPAYSSPVELDDVGMTFTLPPGYTLYQRICSTGT